MTTNRPYQSAMDLDYALGKIKSARRIEIRYGGCECAGCGCDGRAASAVKFSDASKVASLSDPLEAAAS